MSVQDDESEYHIPVLRERAIDLLLSNPSGVYVDGTLGGGGHSRALLQRLGERARVFGFDQDAEAIEHSRRLFADERRISLVHGNVVHLATVLEEHHVTLIDGILLDLGVSSHQIDAARRGFSFRHDGPLDMRMNLETTVTAVDLIASASEDDLTRLFFEWGEERYGRHIARAIIAARKSGRIETTAKLRDVIASAVPPMRLNKILARIFQALRIAVNNELRILEETLREAMRLLAIGGRMVVISYHSLEDRIVKQFLRMEAQGCICPPRSPICVCEKIARMTILTKKHIEADEDEIRRNPRARSARLRAGEKIHA